MSLTPIKIFSAFVAFAIFLIVTIFFDAAVKNNKNTKDMKETIVFFYVVIAVLYLKIIYDIYHTMYPKQTLTEQNLTEQNLTKLTSSYNELVSLIGFVRKASEMPLDQNLINGGMNMADAKLTSFVRSSLKSPLYRDLVEPGTNTVDIKLTKDVVKAGIKMVNGTLTDAHIDLFFAQVMEISTYQPIKLIEQADISKFITRIYTITEVLTFIQALVETALKDFKKV
jgi:hypothetical protein